MKRQLKAVIRDWLNVLGSLHLLDTFLVWYPFKGCLRPRERTQHPSGMKAHSGD
jgi:hypothetical protein